MNDYTVYAHIVPNGKLYIGITHLKPEYRYGKNGNGYCGCTLFWRAIQKYGWDNIKHIIIFENLSKEIACLFEQFLINKYHTNDANYGYNNSLGGAKAAVLDIKCPKNPDEKLVNPGWVNPFQKRQRQK